MSEQDIRAALAARFPVEAHKRVNKGGGDQTYVPAVDIFDRADDVLGLTGWQARVIREGMTATEAWVLAEVTATIDGVQVVRQQYGCESITVGRDAKPVSDLFKKAATDAYKKALTLLGVARYLYDDDERREVEQEMREANRRPRPAAPSKQVENAAALTGAPVAVNTERAKLVKSLEDGIAYAQKIGLEPAMQDMAELTNEQISEMVDDLRTQCRLVLAERKKQGA